MSAFQIRHYTVRLRHSQRMRYRLPRSAWRKICSSPRLVPLTARLLVRLVLEVGVTVAATMRTLTAASTAPARAWSQSRKERQ
jgi:hypothetical protein